MKDVRLLPCADYSTESIDFALVCKEVERLQRGRIKNAFKRFKVVSVLDSDTGLIDFPIDHLQSLLNFEHSRRFGD